MASRAGCLPPSSSLLAGREKMGKEGKGREGARGGREGRNKRFLVRLHLPRNHTYTFCTSLVRTVSHGHLNFPRNHTHTFCISFVRTVSHGHIRFPRSLLHTSTFVPLVRTVSRGHHSRKGGSGELVFLLGALSPSTVSALSVRTDLGCRCSSPTGVSR